MPDSANTVSTQEAAVALWPYAVQGWSDNKLAYTKFCVVARGLTSRRRQHLDADIPAITAAAMEFKGLLERKLSGQWVQDEEDRTKATIRPCTGDGLVRDRALRLTEGDPRG